jgi:hypothetical protein
MFFATIGPCLRKQDEFFVTENRQKCTSEKLFASCSNLVFSHVLKKEHFSMNNMNFSSNILLLFFFCF